MLIEGQSEQVGVTNERIVNGLGAVYLGGMAVGVGYVIERHVSRAESNDLFVSQAPSIAPEST